MEHTVLSVLDSIKSLAVTLAVYGFVAVNGVALAAVLATRSRALVQRWTSPWLATNLLLLGTGLGVPLVAGLCQSVVSVVGAAVVAQQSPTPLD